MIIGVDAGCLGVKDKRLKVGVYQAARNLLEQIGKMDKKNTYVLYSFYRIDTSLVKSFGPNFKNVVVKPVRGWTKIWLPLQLLKDKPDVFLGLSQALPLKLPLQTYKSILIVYDIAFEYHHALYKDSWRKLHEETSHAVKSAESIIAVSQATKTDLIATYAVSPERITVSYLGGRKLPKPKAYDQQKDFYLFVGSLKPSKNIPRLLDAFHRFLEKTHADIDLLLVGGDKWIDERIEESMQKLPEKTKKQIKFVGNIDDDELAWLYEKTLCMVSPSIMEGFGLPFVEALSFGKPVIGPLTGSVPEVVGDAGILVDPKAVQAIATALTRMGDARQRDIFAKKAKQQAARFDWQIFAKTVYTAIQERKG